VQVSPELVDWSWLVQLPDPSARVAALRDPSPGRLMPGARFGCWYSDSAREMQEVGEWLAALADEVGGASAEQIRAAEGRCGRLEPYEAQVSCTVLGGSGPAMASGYPTRGGRIRWRNGFAR
jgi:hypothetical protein